VTEDEARALLDVPRETLERLEDFISYLRQENERQNLVSRASLENVWTRHILDSAQLARFAPPEAGRWIDLGTGAGFPGLILAALHPATFCLVEARRLRVEFLREGARILGVEGRTEILMTKAEAAPTRTVDVISARAFAPLDKLLDLGARFATESTVWVLPKGRNAKSELEAVGASWQGEFELEPSLTDADAQIIVARGVRRKPGGKTSR